MKKTPLVTLFFLTLAGAGLGALAMYYVYPSFHPTHEKGRVVIGRVENIGIEKADTVLKGRIDTGAGMTSIQADIIEIQKAKNPGDSEHVVFSVETADGIKKTFTQKIVEWQEIKKKGAKGFTKRPVVIMDLCIDGKKIKGRVNLADRSGFLYPVLIGRNFLKTGDFYINPERKFMHKPGCI